MATLIASNLDFNSVARIQNLPDAVSNQEPATLNQVNSLVQGLAWKDNVRVASVANITLASPGATIDGITMVVNDRVLVKNQTAQPENGIYIWSGAAVAMTRAVDADATGELNQAVVTVESGTSAGVSFRQSTAAPVLGTSNIVWGNFGTVAPTATTSVQGIVQLATQAIVDAGTDANMAVTPATLAGTTLRLKKYAADIGDGSATSYVVTHNLNTRDIHVQMRRNSGSYDYTIVDVQATTVNTCTIVFASAPAAAAWRVIVMG